LKTVLRSFLDETHITDEAHQAKEAAKTLREPVKEPPPQWHFEDRTLAPQEKRGLWVLLGIVGLGWLAGGLAAPKSTARPERLEIREA
jgi:hypothetical protein